MTDLDEAIVQANELFEKTCQDRHDIGAQKYGENTFLDKDTVQMMQDELVDMSNYARYTFIKLELMRQEILDWQGNGVGVPLEGMERLGKDAVFIPMQKKGNE